VNTDIINRVRIKGLFGLYSYDLPKESIFTNATILYGDNGVGKSTLLRLVYHLLSSAGDRGHRTALWGTEFSSLEVFLSNGVAITAARIFEENISFMRFDIKQDESTVARWNYTNRGSTREFFDDSPLRIVIGNDGRKKRFSQSRDLSFEYENDIATGEGVYLDKLSKCAPMMFMLNADRRLDSDSVADPSDEVELRRLMHFDTPKSINELVQRSREIGLSQALSSASKWISQKAIIATNQGSTNVHSVYTDVVNRIVSPYSNIESKESVSSLVDRLKSIGERVGAHAHYQLATKLSINDFVTALELENEEKAELAAELLKPYIQSLERKLEAVDPIYEVIDSFVKAINNFLNDKRINFQLGKGFQILNPFDSELEASQLSSGEQQLLLLFCYVITARDKPSVFMIDEPEISLNIKWQRQLIQALLEITEGSDIQFIFASHSMELLAQHRHRVVKLENSQHV
jgi:energy-coupling factor transporter ATP-binding protein EcfA2